MKERQIFGVSGNFFRDVWLPPLLQKRLLSLSGAASPTICYVGAANGDDSKEIDKFYWYMNQHDCRPRHFNIFWPCTTDFLDYFLQFDIIYVGGGSTRNLISLLRDHGLDAVFRRAWEDGVVMSGTSAGAICWFEGCITDSLPQQLRPLRCLGFLGGSHCTHFDARPDRPRQFRRCLAAEEIPCPGVATDNDVAVHYVGDTLQECVAQRRDARAIRYVLENGTLQCADLDVRFIG